MRSTARRAPPPWWRPDRTATALTNQNSSGGVTEVMIKKLYLEAKLSTPS